MRRMRDKYKMGADDSHCMPVSVPGSLSPSFGCVTWRRSCSMGHDWLVAKQLLQMRKGNIQKMLRPGAEPRLVSSIN